MTVHPDSFKMSALVGTVLALSCVYNNSLFISRPYSAVGEEAFFCLSYDYQRLPCAWPTEWKRFLAQTINDTNMFVIENITGVHFSKIRYVLKTKQYIDSQWIPVIDTEAATHTNDHHISCIIGFVILIVTSFLMYGGYIVYKRKYRNNKYRYRGV